MLLALALTLGVGPAAAKSTKPTATKVIKIKGIEYKYVGVPTTVKAGRRTIEFVDGGTEAHEMGLVKLKPGKTLQDALQFQGDPSDPNSPMDFVGVVVVGMPSKSIVVTLTDNFTPGTYAMACQLTAPDGKPHAEKGMVASFTVVK